MISYYLIPFGRMLYIVNKDILDVTDGLIVHQCNCVTTKSLGLAKRIFDKYPEANTYIKGKRNFGTIEIIGHVVNFNSQYYPGRPKYPKDNSEVRKNMFINCCKQLSTYVRNNKISEIYFPERIGCNLGGGDWETYINLIVDFSEEVPEAIIYICCI